MPRMETLVVVFLGAGASAPFGYPTIVGLQDVLLKNLADEEKDLFNDLVRRKGVDDVEGVLQTIDLLEIIANHGVGSILTDSFVTLSEMAKERSMKFSHFIELSRSLRNHIQEIIFDVYQFRPDCKSNFRLYSDLFSAISSVTKAKEYSVFTTNYDRIVEEFCASAENYDVRDGFRIDQKSKRNFWDARSFDLPQASNNTLVKLFKLHGSLNWKLSEFGLEQVMPEQRLGKPTPVYKQDVLIYPGSKERPEREPFRRLYDRFDSEMKRADRCLVIGFSFRDQYLNRIFREFVESGKGQLICMSSNASMIVAKNLLDLKDFDTLKVYTETNSFVSIRMHFGDNGWIDQLRNAFVSIPLPIEVPIIDENGKPEEPSAR